jgi:DNA replication protein DnaC
MMGCWRVIMARNQLLEYLKELHLPTVREVFQDLALKAMNNSLSYEQYLLEVIEREIETRRNNRRERLLRESHLPLEKNLSTFDLKLMPQKVIQQCNVLLDGSFLKRNENILVFGNPGSGKTHLLSALGQELILKGYQIFFKSCALLVQELLVAKRDLKLPNMIKRLGKYDAIIIDDIGYVQQSQEEMEVLFTLLAERYERGSIMISSNLPFSQWDKIFKSKMVTNAAVDRLIHHSLVIELNIPSYRLKHAKKINEECSNAK